MHPYVPLAALKVLVAAARAMQAYPDNWETGMRHQAALAQADEVIALAAEPKEPT